MRIIYFIEYFCQCSLDFAPVHEVSISTLIFSLSFDYTRLLNNTRTGPVQKNIQAEWIHFTTAATRALECLAFETRPAYKISEVMAAVCHHSWTILPIMATALPEAVKYTYKHHCHLSVAAMIYIEISLSAFIWTTLNERMPKHSM